RHRSCATGPGKECAACESRTTGCEPGSSDDSAPCGKTCTDRGASTELWSARYDAVGDAGPKDTQAEKRQRAKHKRHDIINRRLIPTKPGHELCEQRRADPDDDG